MNSYDTTITAVLKKAAEAHDSGDAMRFAQAAANVANAAITMNTLKRENSGEANNGSAGS